MRKTIMFNIAGNEIAVEKKSAKQMYEDFGTSYAKIKTCVELGMTLGDAILATCEMPMALIDEIQAAKKGVSWKQILAAVANARRVRKQLLAARTWHIYMLRNKDSKTLSIKVGMSQNWQRRIKTFATFTEKGVELIELIPIPADARISDKRLRDYMVMKGYALEKFREDGSKSEFVEFVDKDDMFTTKDCVALLVAYAREASRDSRIAKMTA